MNTKILPWLSFILLAPSLPVATQEKTLSKLYNPVIIKGEQLPLDSLRLEEWTAYSFNAANATWRVIPFQMDEIDAAGRFLSEHDGFLDDNDELLFMPEDAGDCAPLSSWLTDLTSSTSSRIEIQMVQPLHPQQQAWIFLYRTISNPVTTPGYFQYIPAADSSAADTIQTRSYKLGHNQLGWTDYVSLGLDWHKDLIDRIKFHTNGGSGTASEFYLNEDTLKRTTEQFYLRPVRSFQQVKAKIKLAISPLPTIDKEDHFIISFLPYSTWLGAGFQVEQKLKYLLVLLKIRNLRLSIDLSPVVFDMKFFSAANGSGFSIDGQPDAPNLMLSDINATNWVMASGADGTILTFFDFPKIQGAQASIIYYRDQLLGGSNENTPDTGDLLSFGDMGLWVTGDALVPQANSLYIAFTNYYITEAYQDADFARTVLESIQNPLSVVTRLQSNSTNVIENQESLPANCQLHDAYPNPFAVNSGKVVFSIDLIGQDRSVELTVFNLLGQLVARLSCPVPDNKSGMVKISWDGKNLHGETVPAGLYFYQLQGRQGTPAKKLLLLR